MEQHRIETAYGPIEVRVYRLKHGWWPVAVGGRAQLPADPVIEGDALPTSVEAALQRLWEAVDAMRAERPLPGDGAAGRRRPEDSTSGAAAVHRHVPDAGERLDRR